ncbi:MAG: OmpH family outer membrane protein [Proteobacteria bacterium]|nr:OmpH family outer membrane protein [Pseudomonadota bacterium]
MSTRTHRSTLVLGLLGVGLIVSPLFAGFATSAVPQQPKIGMVDIEATLQKTPAGKRASTKFETTRKAKQVELDKKMTDLKASNAELEKQAAILKPDVLDSKKQALQKKYVELQQTYAKLEQDLAGERAKLIEELLKLATPKIEEIAKAEGVTVIFERESMVWWDPAIDLTAKLQAKMQ